MFARPTGLTFEAALRDIGSTKPRDRRAAADALGKAQSDDEKFSAIEALSVAASDPHPHVRTAACFSLGSLQRPAAWMAIALCLEDEMPDVRQAAAIALGTLGARESFSALLSAFQNGPSDVRFQAATSLAQVDPGAAYEPLVAGLNDSDPEVQGAIALALGDIGDASCADLVATLLDSMDSQTRLDAAYTLALFRDPRASDTLAAALLHKNTCWDAVCALETLGATSLPRLIEFLQRTDGLPQGRLRAAGAVLSLAESATEIDLAQSCLCRGLKERKLESRGLAIQLLEAHGGSWAIEPLTACQHSRRGRYFQDEIAAALAAISRRV